MFKFFIILSGNQQTKGHSKCLVALGLLRDRIICLRSKWLNLGVIFNENYKNNWNKQK